MSTSVNNPGLASMACPQSISGLVVEYIVAIDVTRVRFPADAYVHVSWLSERIKARAFCLRGQRQCAVFDDAGSALVIHRLRCISSISGLVVEYIVAIDVTRVRFPADASC